MQLHAQPYAYDARGFYFSSPTEFSEKFAAGLRRGVEEYEIDFIDGTPEQAALFNASGVNQATVHNWFDSVHQIGRSQERAVAALYLMEHEGLRGQFDEVLRRIDDVMIRRGDAKDALWELIEDQGGVAKIVEAERKSRRRIDMPVDMYFDYEQFGRDVRLEGVEETRHTERMSDEKFGEEYVSEVSGNDSKDIPAELVERYFDMDAYARDVGYNGELHTFRMFGEDWTVLS